METPADVSARLRIVERQLRSYRVALIVGVILAAAVVTRTASAGASQDQGIQRTRGLVIEDAAGKDRIVMGAPIAEPSGRVSPCTGLRVNDPQGVERFAACLFADGRVVMGFDAPVGKGDDRNRERMTLVADAEGGAYVRFLNRKTGVSGRLMLGADDNLYLEFIQNVDGKLRAKRISFDGEEVADLK